MRIPRQVAGNRGWLFMVILAAASCSKRADRDALTRMDQLAFITAERDSLLREVAENSRLMTDIGTELGRIEQPDGTDSVESPGLKTTLSGRAFVLDQIQEVTARVQRSEQRLAASEKRLRRLAQSSDSLKTRVAGFESSIVDLKAVVESQKATIGILLDEVNALQTENTRLAGVNSALNDTLGTLTAEANTVYYVVGKKRDLIARGLIVEEGGTRLLFLGSRAVQPARGLQASQFTAIDKREVSEIPLPRPGKTYRIVSRQNLDYLAARPGDHGRISGSIQIASPEEFWAPSKYLIVVEQ